MKNIPAITLVLLCALLFSSCTTKKTLEITAQTEYSELGSYARFSVYLGGQYEEMGIGVDSLLTAKIPSWKQLSFEEHKAFVEHVRQTMIHQMDNTKAIVYKSATYNLKGIEEVNDPVSITITLGKPIHAYEDDEDVLTGYIKFNDEPQIDLYYWTLNLPITIEIHEGEKSLGKLDYEMGYVLDTEKHISDFAEAVWDVRKRNNESNK